MATQSVEMLSCHSTLVSSRLSFEICSDHIPKMSFVEVPSNSARLSMTSEMLQYGHATHQLCWLSSRRMTRPKVPPAQLTIENPIEKSHETKKDHQERSKRTIFIAFFTCSSQHTSDSLQSSQAGHSLQVFAWVLTIFNLH